MSGAHAFLPPSGSWSQCAAWAQMNARYPETGDQLAALEGTAAHWVFAEVVAGRLPPPGSATPTGIPVDEAMLSGAFLLLGEVAGPGWLIEQTVVNSAIHVHCWGTPDAAHFQPGRLKIVDYKYGYGVVDVYRNPQLLAYAALLLEHFGVDGLADQATSVEMVVVQPRAHHREGPVRRWTVRASDLRADFNKLRHQAEAAMLPEPPSRTGSHCAYCPGRHACETLQRSAYTAIDVSGQGLPLELSDGAMGRELRVIQQAMERLKARAGGLEAQIEQRLRSGASVPGWRLEKGESRERWAKPPEEIIALGRALGLPLEKPAVLTPNQARAAGVSSEIVAAYSERPPAAMKLAATDGTQAAKVFGK